MNGLERQGALAETVADLTLKMVAVDGARAAPQFSGRDRAAGKGREAIVLASVDPGEGAQQFVTSAAEAELAAKRFRDDHMGHADAINALVVSHGGKAHECANTRVNNLYVYPALKLITAERSATWIVPVQ